LRPGVNYLQACEAAPAAQRGRAAIGRALREMLAGRADGFTSQYQLQPDRGSTRWFDVRATPFRGGGPGRVVMQHYDSTHFVIAQRSARVRSQLLDEIDAAIVGCDLAAGIRAGRTMHDAVHVHHPSGRFAPVEECPFVRAHRAREKVRVEEDTFIRGDGSKSPVAYVLAPLESAEGEGSVIVFSDITRIKAERQRMQVESERISHVRAERIGRPGPLEDTLYKAA
jgi:hypothetical protein